MASSHEPVLREACIRYPSAFGVWHLQDALFIRLSEMLFAIAACLEHLRGLEPRANIDHARDDTGACTVAACIDRSIVCGKAPNTGS